MKERMKKIRHYIRERMDRTPLWAEFTLFMALILILLTFVMSVSVYRREKARTTDAQLMAAQSLLNLKMANLEEYIDALSDFAILPVYDSELYTALLSGGEMSDRVLESIRSSVRTFFYTRDDLLSYHIYLLKQDIVVGRDYHKEGVRIDRAEDMKTSELYRACSESDKNYAILPSEHPDALFRFVHSIIRIRDKSIVALVEFEVDHSAIDYLSSQSAGEGEILSLYNTDGALLYTDAEGGLYDYMVSVPSRENVSRFLSVATDGRAVDREIDGTDYLLTVSPDSDHVLILSSLNPLSEILAQIRRDRGYAILIGLFFLLIAVIGAYLLIRYLSAPLSELVRIQESYGEGQTGNTDLGRSRESRELSRSFNEMTNRIETLLQENYAAELNERSARLAALEAQVNSHFLYNTLQAIGSQALLNDQTEIYRMLTSLASNLHYSIKGPNVATLRDELKYVDNYILLQKIRMEERLSVSREIDGTAMDFRLPKMCIQTLIENSILHGIDGDRTSISILLKIKVMPESIFIRVHDDGVGIPAEKLARLRSSFRSQTLQDANQGIGLANLYNRLLLLYGQEMNMIINSVVGEDSFTEVLLMLPGHIPYPDARDTDV